MTVLAARVGAESFDWIGTSLGGLMGIVLAGVPNSPIRRLVINDIAPEVPTAALQRLALYLGADRRFPDLKAVEAHLRETLAPFGPMTDADWRRMAETSVRQSVTATGWPTTLGSPRTSVASGFRSMRTSGATGTGSPARY